jgi:hypothetical protein
MIAHFFNWVASDGLIAGYFWALLFIAAVPFLFKTGKYAGYLFPTIVLLNVLLLAVRITVYQNSGASQTCDTLLLWYLFRATMQHIMIILAVAFIGVLRYWNESGQLVSKFLRVRILICIGVLLGVLAYEYLTTNFILCHSWL